MVPVESEGTVEVVTSGIGTVLAVSIGGGVVEVSSNRGNVRSSPICASLSSGRTEDPELAVVTLFRRADREIQGA